MSDYEKEDIRAVTARIESCLNKGMLCEAQDLAQKAKASFPNAIRITQLYALALARLGAPEKARTYGRSVPLLAALAMSSLKES